MILGGTCDECGAKMVATVAVRFSGREAFLWWTCPDHGPTVAMLLPSELGGILGHVMPYDHDGLQHPRVEGTPADPLHR